MNINSVGINSVTKIYNEANRKTVDKKSETNKSDSIEISNIGKSLSSFSLEQKLNVSNERLESLSNQVSKGTYNVDSNVLATKLLNILKGKEA